MKRLLLLALLLSTTALSIAPVYAFQTPDSPALPAVSELTNGAFARDGYAGIADVFLSKTRYLLSLDVDWPRGFITGSARIFFVNGTPDTLNKVVFRLYPNHPLPAAYGGTYTGAKPRMLVKSVSVGGATVDWKTRDRYQTVLDVPLGAALAPGEQAQIDVTYTVQYAPPTDALDAREAFPLLAVYENGAWREDILTKSLDYVFSETALYAVRLRSTNGVALYVTGSITRTQAIGQEVEYQITTGPVRDFVFVLSKGWGFLPGRGAPSPIDVRFKGKEETAQEMASLGVEAMAYYDKTFGPYLYAHLTLLAMVYPSGGEEFPTLTFVDSQRDSAYRRFIVAHEVAHQWFYGIAGNDIAKHAWLDESLAQISMYLFYRDRYGQAVADREWQYVLTWANRLKGDPRPIDTPVEQFRDFPEYMVHTYGLGPVFLRQVAEKIGYEAFKAGLASYYETASLKVGTPMQFYEAIQGQTSIPLADMFCKTMGFPC